MLRRLREATLDLGGLLRREAEHGGLFVNHTQEQIGNLVLTIGRKLAELRDCLFESFSHGATLAWSRTVSERAEVAQDALDALQPRLGIGPAARGDEAVVGAEA